MTEMIMNNILLIKKEDKIENNVFIKKIFLMFLYT